MRYERDKDLGWLIAFASFLVFLLSAIASSALEAAPSDLPQAVVLANANLGRAFVSVLALFVRYAAVGGLVYGIIGIVTWPPGAS